MGIPLPPKTYCTTDGWSLGIPWEDMLTLWLAKPSNSDLLPSLSILIDAGILNLNPKIQSLAFKFSGYEKERLRDFQMKHYDEF